MSGNRRKDKRLPRKIEFIRILHLSVYVQGGFLFYKIFSAMRYFAGAVVSFSNRSFLRAVILWVLPRKGDSLMAKIELKQPIVEEIKAKVDGVATVVLVDYRGLTVEQDTRLRKNLREAGCEYKVYKNTLMKRAFEGTDFAQLDELLDGPSAIAISKEDATAPIRILNDMAKEAEALEFKGAIVEGTFYDVDGIKTLASIPSREELISKLLGSLQSPITNLARVLNQIAEKGDGAAAEA